MLLGCSYVPLRKEFQDLSAVKQNGKNEIFVSSGGTDTEHIEIRMLEHVFENKERYHDYTFHFVVGAMNEDWPEMQMIAVRCPNVVLHRNVSQMSKLMCRCDLAVSAAGSTLYELSRCEVPIITYVVADNQIQGANGFSKRGAAWYAGDARVEHDLPEKILDMVLQYYQNKCLADKIYGLQTGLVDGNGAGRIAKALISAPLEIEA